MGVRCGILVVFVVGCRARRIGAGLIGPFQVACDERGVCRSSRSWDSHGEGRRYQIEEQRVFRMHDYVYASAWRVLNLYGRGDDDLRSLQGKILSLTYLDQSLLIMKTPHICMAGPVLLYYFDLHSQPTPPDHVTTSASLHVPDHLSCHVSKSYP